VRICLCDLCGDILRDNEVFELETCHVITGKGLSFEICEHCNNELQSKSEGITFDLLFKEDKNETEN